MADESDEDDELEEGGDNAMFTGVDEAEFCAQLEELAVNAGDDPLDATWLPPKQAKHATLLGSLFQASKAKFHLLVPKFRTHSPLPQLPVHLLLLM